VAGWAQEDVDGGGGFYPTENSLNYRRFSSSTNLALATIESWQKAGYGTTLSVGGNMAHSITCWGFDKNAQGAYTSVWVTDSDDDKNGNGVRPNVLHEYGVVNSGGRWYLQNYYGTNNTFITEVVGLKKMQTVPVVPLPSAGLMGLGLMGVLLTIRRIRRKR